MLKLDKIVYELECIQVMINKHNWFLREQLIELQTKKAKELKDLLEKYK